MNRRILGVAAVAAVVLMFAAGAAANQESRVADELLTNASGASGSLMPAVEASRIGTATPVVFNARRAVRTDTPVYVASSKSSQPGSSMSLADRKAKAAAEQDAAWDKFIEDYEAGLYNN